MKIKYLEDITDPPSQRGSAGDIKEVGEDISKADARLLLNGGHVESIKEVKQAEEAKVPHKKKG